MGWTLLTYSTKPNNKFLLKTKLIGSFELALKDWEDKTVIKMKTGRHFFFGA